jgi:hypothetical protein
LHISDIHLLKWNIIRVWLFMYFLLNFDCCIW